MKILLTVLTAVVLAFPAFAYRVEFLVTHDGKPVEDSEICFFSSTSVLNPFGHFLASDDVRCLPAGMVIDMPAGQWNFFGRAGDRFTSAGPALLQFTGNDQREIGYQAMTVPMSAAAVLDFSAVRKTLAADESLVVFVPTPFGHASNVRPVPRGGNEVLVPAETPLVPLVVRNGRPVRIGDVVELEPGQRRKAAFPAPAAGTGDVVLWLDFDAEMARHLDPAEPAGAPKIAVVSNKGEQQPLLAVENAAVSHLSFVFFRGVPAGPARVTMQGELWEPSEVAVSVADGAVAVIDEPLSVAPAGTVTLRWRIDGDPKRPGTRETCEGPVAAAKAESGAKRTLRITRCDGDSPDDCRVYFEQELAAGAAEGTARVASLATGRYTAELRVPPFAPVREEIYVLPRRAADLDLVAAPVTIYGSVTREGKPVRAAVSLAGEWFVSEESGAFSAVVLRAPGTTSVEVRPCDTKVPFVHRPEAPLGANSFLAIDIPRRALEVRVVDRDSEEPLDDARVTLVIPRTDRPGETAAALALRYEEARSLYVLSPYSPQHSRVCATAAGHEQACVDIAAESVSSEPLVVALERRKGGAPGRVVTVQPIVEGLLYVAAPGGEVLERALIAKDGAFELASLPPPGASYVLTARNQPLSALALQPGADPLILTSPPAPSRHFVVRIEPAGAVEQGRIAFALGGTRIPIEAFERHQQLRGWAPLFVTARPYYVGDVAEAGAISARLIPIGSGEGAPQFSGVLPPDNDLLILR